MRELVFKFLTSADRNKRDILTQETMEKEGMLAKVERHCRYFVMSHTHIDDPNDIEQLAKLKNANFPSHKRHYFVLKTHNSEHREDGLLCKVAGSFYVVNGTEVYTIAFVHSYKIRFSPSPSI
jgi:hypothetical protein